jgi:hypothetical protein
MKKGARKQFCINGHDTFLCGRHPQSRQCLACRDEREKFCPNGHEYAVVGQLANYQCIECHKVPFPLKPICSRGHDKSIVGVNSEGKCMVCIKQRKKVYHATHKEQLSITGREYYETHGEEVRKRVKEYIEENKDLIRENKRIYTAMKRKTDPLYKLKSNLRRRLLVAIKNNQKVGSAVRDLGCTIEFLKEYLETMFYDGMTWNNWGEVWELDHIIPLWTFDLANREEFLIANNYTNLQPLTVKDHKKKSDAELKEFFKLRRNNGKRRK